MKLAPITMMIFLLLFPSSSKGANQNKLLHATENHPSQLRLADIPVWFTMGELPLTPGYIGCGGVADPPSSNSLYEQSILELVNQQRQANGIPPVKRQDNLDQAARYYARDMGEDSYFPQDHGTYDRINGHLSFICTWDARILSYYPPPGQSFAAIAENIAGGQSSPQGAMNSWMNSSGHRANILDPDHWEIGIGYYQGGPYGHYWVQDFGKRNGIYPLIINLDNAETNDPHVSLYIYGSGSWDEMRLRNDAGAWGNWQSFQSIVNWTLSNTGGLRTVSVELRKSSQTTTSSDTIFLIDVSSMTQKVFLPMLLK